MSIFEEKANKAIDELIIEGRPFTFGTFERKFTVTHRSFRFFEFLDEIIVDLKKKDKVGNAATYKQLRNALWKFTENANLMFPDINYRFLKKFEAYLFGRGCSGGGVNYYMRTLRAIINEAIRQDYMHRDLYPFSTQFNKRGYSLNSLKSNAKPRALSIEDMNKIKNFPMEEYPHLAESVRYFLFSYYARGMNFIDMAKLRWQDIYGGRISYKRSKTRKMYNIKVSDPLEDFLEHVKGSHDVYVFLILNEIHQTPK